jgi:hypothetical protein
MSCFFVESPAFSENMSCFYNNPSGNPSCMPMENGPSYSPGIASAHSNAMSLVVFNKIACGGWEVCEFTTFP